MNSIQRIANITLIGAGGCCILFFLFNVTRHGWVLHYILFPALAVVFFAALKLRASIRVNLALFLVSAAIALYGAEALLGQVIFTPNRFSMNDWLNFPEDANSSVAVNRIKQEKPKNARFDTRTRLEVVRDLRKQGVNAFPDVFPAVLFQSNGKQVITSLFAGENGEFFRWPASPMPRPYSVMRAENTLSTAAMSMGSITLPASGTRDGSMSSPSAILMLMARACPRTKVSFPSSDPDIRPRLTSE
jgi:hypothetical protein